MLIVLIILLMTTATATFAVHATSVEIRAAGHVRQAVQAEHLAEGGAYAAVSYLDVLKANGSLAQYLRTDVAANVSSSAGEASIGRQTNLLRIRMQDFDGAPGVNSPPLETEVARTPSFGPTTAYVPDFTVDGTDLHQLTRDAAGRDLTGRGASYYRVTLTSRSSMAPPNDYRADAEQDERDRTYNEVAMRARAFTEVGPFWLGGH